MLRQTRQVVDRYDCHVITSEMLTSPIFTIVANDREDEPLKAHLAMLERSPVLKAMCKSPFQESQDLHIKLPEDGFHETACLIQFLYTGDFDEGHFPYSRDDFLSRPDSDWVFEICQFAARVYVLADKYQIEGLKLATTDKIMSCTKSSDSRALFQAGRIIYEKTSTSDQIFRKQFKDQIGYVFEEKMDVGSAGLAAVITEMLMAGGNMALDIFEAQRAALR